MSGKQRLSVTVDAELLAKAEQAVELGDAANLSEWISDAIRQKVETDARLTALRGALDEFEAAFGPITEADKAAATREARRRALVVRGTRASEGRGSKAAERRGRYGR